MVEVRSPTFKNRKRFLVSPLSLSRAPGSRGLVTARVDQLQSGLTWFLGGFGQKILAPGRAGPFFYLGKLKMTFKSIFFARLDFVPKNSLILAWNSGLCAQKIGPNFGMVRPTRIFFRPGPWSPIVTAIADGYLDCSPKKRKV